MKNIYIKIVLLILPISIYCQVKIGGLQTNVIHESVILQFGDSTDGTITNPNDKGLLLPTIISDYVKMKSDNEGTLFYDVKDGKIKVLSKIKNTRSGENGLYFDEITPLEGNPLKHFKIYFEPQNIHLNENRDISFLPSDYLLILNNLSNSLEDEKTKGIIIGNESSDSDGALIIEAQGKGILLPRVYQPHINIKNPDPGLVCFDTDKGMIALFDGNVWHYYK